ncbi:MAG: 50S ribosomal protein L17 [Candidatus Improbicoccus pseudotrichonymphae]|uniref:50S ribosomal protein L17 n=1 Tax=Candidatus Improbicoccus pseudotrichonymphae TaxID=3033792 RepID=A0AA48HUJ0_9FIRM|nr:MAG: 50S ribosomal protein L17 [Candidatus Improbicoccus pseudotrichonymphae]
MYLRKLNKKTDHRISMLKTMFTELLECGEIKTTLSKAREISCYTEGIISKVKDDSLSTKRRLFSIIRKREIVNKLLSNIKPDHRIGGASRVIKLGKRKGDAAEMALVQLSFMKN